MTQLPNSSVYQSFADGPTADLIDEFNKNFGDALLHGGFLDNNSRSRADRLCQDESERLNKVVPKLGLVADEVLARQLAEFLGLTLLSEVDYPLQPILVEGFSTRFMKKYCLVPISGTDNAVVVAMADPLDFYAINAMRLGCGREVEVRVAIPVDVERALSRYDSGHQNDLAHSDLATSSQEDIERLRDLASEAPVVQTVSQIINQAVELGASDIHIEPQQAGLRLRYRIDGQLQTFEAPPADMKAAIV